MITFPLRIALGCLCVSMHMGTYSQETVSLDRELSISSANDAYVIWQNSDRFYSFGMGANLKFKTEKFLGLQNHFQKKNDYFFELGLRLEGYTPTNKEVTPMEIRQNTISFDRPYAGLLYGTLNVTYAFERSLFKGGMVLGVLGPSSLAGDFQAWFHDTITNDPVFEEWKFQVPDQLVLNIEATYGYDFLPRQKWFDLYGMLNTRFGNLYMDVTPTLGFRIGKFKKLSESISTDSNILSHTNDMEVVLQTTLSGTLNAFDATAQGNLFNTDFPYAIDTLNAFHSVVTQSLYLTFSRCSLGIEHHFSFGKVVPRERHIYARTIFKYRF